MNDLQALLVKAAFGGELDSDQAAVSQDCGHQIVICQRGFVFAGDVCLEGEGVVITNAVNIRRWGTTKGLGELAASGVTSDTKADASGTVRVHQLAVVARIDCKVKINATT